MAAGAVRPPGCVRPRHHHRREHGPIASCPVSSPFHRASNLCASCNIQRQSTLSHSTQCQSNQRQSVNVSQSTQRQPTQRKSTQRTATQSKRSLLCDWPWWCDAVVIADGQHFDGFTMMRTKMAIWGWHGYAKPLFTRAADCLVQCGAAGEPSADP